MQYYQKAKFRYWLKAAHGGGHGIHSPFLFRLITKVIEDKRDYPAYRIPENAEKNIRMMVKMMNRSSFETQNSCTLGNASYDIFKLHKLALRFDKLLLRLVNEFKPESISFNGSTLGGTLISIACSNRKTNVNATVSDLHYRMFCEKLVEIHAIENITISKESSGTQADFIVIQHPLEPARSDSEMEKRINQSESDFVLIVSGIHVSEQIEAVWIKHKLNPIVRVALDLFDIGILICRKGLQKEEFILRY
jgi:hypothetical protein